MVVGAADLTRAFVPGFDYVIMLGAGKRLISTLATAPRTSSQLAPSAPSPTLSTQISSPQDGAEGLPSDMNPEPNTLLQNRGYQLAAI